MNKKILLALYINFLIIFPALAANEGEQAPECDVAYFNSEQINKKISLKHLKGKVI